MKKKLLVIIDMVNGFVKEGALADPQIGNITEEVVNLTKTFIQNNDDVIAFTDNHTVDSNEIKEGMPIHCITETYESENINELKPFERNIKLIKKNSTSGYVTKKFQQYLKDNSFNLSEIVVVGCCTDICIMNFAIPTKCYINENNLPIKVIVPENAIATFNAENHNNEEYSHMAKVLMKQSGINVIKKY